MPSPSLTQLLISSDPQAFQRATQSDFLALAAQGRVSKDLLGKWLANDRLYIHGYIRGIGRLLGDLDMSGPPTPEGHRDGTTTRLLDWLVGALVNIRREERFFVKTAARYGIAVDLERDCSGNVQDSAKLDGLRQFEALFSGVKPGKGPVLPWLEAAVLFWATEKCYLDAWSWARSQLNEREDGSRDADGGAVRNEFISNWTGPEFVRFVEELGELIDEVVGDVVGVYGDAVMKEVLDRAKGVWGSVLAAEEAFWPDVA